MRSKGVIQIAVVALMVLAISNWSFAAEHPKEHPAEHPTKGEKAEISKEKLAEAIKDYVKKDSALKGGYFMVYDEKAGKPLALSLVKVHKERLSTIGDGVYFACADFETPAGKVYDLDIFMKGPDKHHLTVTEISVHKEAGLERYTWHEEGGIWKKHHMEGSASKGSETKGSGSKHEHQAEHPSQGSASKGSDSKHEHPAEHPAQGSETKGSGTKEEHPK